MVLALLFGVIFIDCRGRRPRRPVYKNIIVFRADDQWSPLPICEKFDILIVGTGVPDGPRAIRNRPYGFVRV